MVAYLYKRVEDAENFNVKSIIYIEYPRLSLVKESVKESLLFVPYSTWQYRKFAEIPG
jgi:hypothetical protein